MGQLLAVGLGGFVGAITRYGIGGGVHRLYGDRFPMGTLVVNVLGCLLIGMLMSLFEERQLFSPSARLFLSIGFLGSLTTFSTMGYETVQYLRDSAIVPALLNVLANAVLGIGAVLLGRLIVRSFGA